MKKNKNKPADGPMIVKRESSWAELELNSDSKKKSNVKYSTVEHVKAKLEFDDVDDGGILSSFLDESPPRDFAPQRWLDFEKIIDQQILLDALAGRVNRISNMPGEVDYFRAAMLMLNRCD